MAPGISGKTDAQGESECSPRKARSLAFLWSVEAMHLPCEARRVTCQRSPADVAKRLDRLIEDIRRRFHAPAVEAPKDNGPPPDVLLVAHGHILRAFAMRWVGKLLEDGPTFLLEAGGVGTLR